MPKPVPSPAPSQSAKQISSDQTRQFIAGHEAGDPGVQSFPGKQLFEGLTWASTFTYNHRDTAENIKGGLVVGMNVASVGMEGKIAAEAGGLIESGATKTVGQLGRNGETAVTDATGVPKNTQTYTVNGRDRVPDFVPTVDPATGLPTSIIESKNVQYQSLTLQLRDYRDLVGAGGRVDVALPTSAKVSGPLQKAFDDPSDPLFRMDIVK